MFDSANTAAIADIEGRLDECESGSEISSLTPEVLGMVGGGDGIVSIQ